MTGTTLSGVVEYTEITGTGNYTGLKPVPGQMAFFDAVSTGSVVTVTVTDGIKIERSRGIYSSALKRVTRVTVLFPLSGAVDWGVGRKYVILDISGSISFTDIIGIATVAQGGTGADLSATGGTSQVVRQSTVGGNFTVSQLGVSELSGLGTNVATLLSGNATGSGSPVGSVSPTLTGVPLAPTASAATNNTQIATTAYADAAVAAIIAAADAMVFKGVIDCSANPNYPAADRGWTYRVSVAGKIGGASGVNVEVGDLLICLTDGTASGNQVTVGTSWTVVQNNLDGAVIGPSSAVDNRIAAFDGTTGKLIKDGGILTSAILVSGGALGTPSSGTLTNATGLPISTGVSGLAAGIATFLVTPNSANLISAVTDETGTGALVFANTPTFVTPLLGTPTSGNLLNCTGYPTSSLTGGIATANGMLKADGAGVVSAATFEQDFGLPSANIDLDFTTGIYFNAPQNPASPFTFTRASVGYISSTGLDTGTWSSVASGVLRRNSIGALIEEARTNSIRNNSTTGAVAGSAGTLPTNWALAVPTGLTRTITLGTTNGVEYIDINWSGTASSTASIVLSTELASQITSINGEIWADSAWISNSASTGITTFLFQHQQLDSGSVSLALSTIGSSILNSAWGRVGGTITNNNASTAFVRTRLATSSITNGTVVNVTVRIGWPMMEKVTDSSFTYSSPIRTTSAAVTRAADVLDVNLPPSFGTSYTLRAGGAPNYATGYNADQYLVSVSDGTSSNRYGLLRLAATGIPQWVINSTKTAIGTAAWAVNTNKKIAGANAVSSQAASFDGAAVVTGSSATSPTGLTKVSLGHDGTGASQWNGYIDRVVILPKIRLGNQAVVSVAGSSVGGNGYVVPSGATYQATPSNPTGTTNTTGLMMGLAGGITPAKSGDVLMIISGTIFNATAIADGGKVQIRYGSTATPANGDALTGTAVGSQPQYIASTTAEKVPFTCNAIVSGLVRGTFYWIDLGLAAITGGTASISDVSMSIVEL